MARKEKKYHYIYKTTNLKTGKFYVGMHSTYNLNDGYLGSGTKLRRSIRKHGEENFKLEIIEFLPDRNALKQREKEIVNEDLLKDPMCMNLQIGGGGGFMNTEHQQKACRSGFRSLHKKMQDDLEFRSKVLKQRSERLKSLHKEGKLTYRGFVGKHSDETKRKISETNKIKQSGQLNSQYGTMWITNGEDNKKIKKEDKMPDGWYKGYIPKKR